MQGVLAPKYFRLFLLPIGLLETNIKYTKLYFLLLECEVLSFNVFGKHNQWYSRTWCRGEHLNPNGSNRTLQKIARGRDSLDTLLSKYFYEMEL
jgi:hypothetical protein